MDKKEIAKRKAKALAAVAKMNTIKNETQASWSIVRRAAGATAKDGIIDVSAAIAWFYVKYRICLN